MKLFKFGERDITSPEEAINESVGRKNLSSSGKEFTETEDERRVEEPNTFKTEKDVASIDEIYNFSVSQPEEYDFIYYQEVLGLEDWELADLMEGAYNHVFNDTKKPDTIPLQEEQMEDLANLYKDYLASQNEYHLPFKSEEIDLLTDKEKEKYRDLNARFIEKFRDFNREEKKFLDGSHHSRLIDRNNEDQLLKLIPRISALENTLKNEIEKRQTAIRKKEIIPKLQKQITRKKNRAALQALEEEQARLNNKEISFKDVDLPDYQPEELESQEECLKQMSLNKPHKEAVMIGEGPKRRALEKYEVASLALDGIERKLESGELLLDNFRAGKKKNQLIAINKIGKTNGKIIYICDNTDLMPGQYAFSFHVDNNIDKITQAQINENAVVIKVNIRYNVKDMKKIASEKKISEDVQNKAVI